MNPDPVSNESRSAIVITVEGLGARWLEPWGCGSVRTPAVNRLAAEGILIENSQAIRGGAGSQWKQWLDPAGSGATGWLDSLRNSGRITVLMTDSASVASACEPHFEEVVELEPLVVSSLADSWTGTQLLNFFAGAAELARTLPEQGTLLWIHSAGFHLPWDAPWEMRLAAKGEDDPDPPDSAGPPWFESGSGEAFTNDLITGWQQALAAQIHVFDLALAHLLEIILDPESFSAVPLVCLAGTGGYGMGEHHRIGPNEPGLYYDEYLHVPLVCRFPDTDFRNFRLQQLMSVDRLPAIVRGWMEGERPEEILNPTVFPERSNHFLLAHSSGARMIRTSAWKLVLRGKERQLFLKPDDRWDRNDVANLCRDVAGILENLIDQFPGSTGEIIDGPAFPLPDLLIPGIA